MNIPKEFKFSLHPLQWIEPEDSETIFTAHLLGEKLYVVSWDTKDGFETMTYRESEVAYALKEGYWEKKDD